VTQQFPTSAQVIFDVLAADTTFTDLLGTYEFRAGQTQPALSIVTPGQDMPALKEVYGVECIIHDVGDVEQFHYLSDDAARVSVSWDVFLVCWEPATGADMQAATERLCSRFYGASSLQTVATSDGLGSLVQTKVNFRSDMPIN